MLMCSDAEQKQLEVAESFIRKITPDAAMADEICSAFRSEVEKGKKEEWMAVIDAVGMASDWKFIYFVDWKDDESFVQSIAMLAKNFGCEVTLPYDEEECRIHELIPLAHLQLVEKGLGLWCYDEGGDSYCGWIGHLSDEPFFEQMAEVLEIEISLGIPF
jgi:hypothetical protein